MRVNLSNFQMNTTTTSNGISPKLTPGRLSVPGSGNRLSASRKIRSFDCGYRTPMTNLLEVDSSSATVLTAEYRKEGSLEIGKPHLSADPR